MRLAVQVYAFLFALICDPRISIAGRLEYAPRLGESALSAPASESRIHCNQRSGNPRLNVRRSRNHATN